MRRQAIPSRRCGAFDEQAPVTATIHLLTPSHAFDMKTTLFLLLTAITMGASFSANAGPDWHVIETARANAHKLEKHQCVLPNDVTATPAS